MPRTLSFNDALNMVDDAMCVKVDDNELLYPMVDLGENYIRLDSEHGDPIIIKEFNNEFVSVKDGELVFNDEDEKPVTLMLLSATLVK